MKKRMIAIVLFLLMLAPCLSGCDEAAAFAVADAFWEVGDIADDYGNGYYHDGYYEEVYYDEGYGYDFWW